MSYIKLLQEIEEKGICIPYGTFRVYSKLCEHCKYGLIKYCNGTKYPACELQKERSLLNYKVGD